MISKYHEYIVVQRGTGIQVRVTAKTKRGAIAMAKRQQLEGGLEAIKQNPNPRKSASLKNFTGVVRRNKNGTVDIIGREG